MSRGGSGGHSSSHSHSSHSSSHSHRASSHGSSFSRGGFGRSGFSGHYHRRHRHDRFGYDYEPDYGLEFDWFMYMGWKMFKLGIFMVVIFIAAVAGLHTQLKDTITAVLIGFVITTIATIGLVFLIKLIPRRFKSREEREREILMETTIKDVTALPEDGSPEDEDGDLL